MPAQPFERGNGCGVARELERADRLRDDRRVGIVERAAERGTLAGPVALRETLDRRESDRRARVAACEGTERREIALELEHGSLTLVGVVAREARVGRCRHPGPGRRETRPR